MNSPRDFYQLLLDSCASCARIEQVLIGQVWTLVKNSDGGIGLAMTPQTYTRTLPWSGTPVGRSVNELAGWVMSWQPIEACVGMATVNSCLNARALPDSEILDNDGENANLVVFDYFLPQLKGKNVVVIGRYPNLADYAPSVQILVLEKLPHEGDLPDSACEFLLPQADWVFISASSIPNKTFPRLAQLSQSAKTVLMGPTTPWVAQLHEFDVDYVAGVEITDSQQLIETISQGGGVKIFSQGLRYRVTELSETNSLVWLKQQIADCAAHKAQLTANMEQWYANGNMQRFPAYAHLELVNAYLSRLDSSYKVLWDKQQRTAEH